jgi:hypothetical protein
MNHEQLCICFVYVLEFVNVLDLVDIIESR